MKRLHKNPKKHQVKPQIRIFEYHTCLDGAAAESFFATIKAEIGTDTWPDRASARRDIEAWIKSYNERRLHSAIGHLTPAEARIAWQHRMSTAA